MPDLISILFCVAGPGLFALQIIIIMKQEELRQALVAANAKVDKIAVEVQSLKDRVDQSGDVPQDIVDAVNSLSATLQRVDDINPDTDQTDAPAE